MNENKKQLDLDYVNENYVSKIKIMTELNQLKMELRYDFIDNRKAIKVLEDLLK